MGDQIRGTDGISTVEHSQQENEAVALVSGLILPVPPDGMVGSIAFTGDMRQYRTHYNGHKDPNDDEEAAEQLNRRKGPVHVQHGETGDPGNEDVGDKHLPPLCLEPVMHHRIHGDCLRGYDLQLRSECQKPRQAIPPAGEPAASAPVSSGSDGSPMVDCLLLSLVQIDRLWGGGQWVSLPPPDEGMAEANSAMEAPTIQ